MNLVRIVTAVLVLAAMSIVVTLYLAHKDAASASGAAIRPFANFDPLAHCVTPYETLLGVADHVPAFSNCHTMFKSTATAFVSLSDPMDVSTPYDQSVRGHVMTAARYGPMDYVMRWMAFNRGLMPHMQEDAQQWWTHNYFFNPAKTTQDWDGEYIDNYMEGSTVDERKFIAPRRADIVAYAGNSRLGFTQGHSAVVVKVEDDVEAAGGREQLRKLKETWLHPRKVYVAEQNMRNEDWGGKNYSRIIAFRWRATRSGGMEGYLEDDTGLTVLGRLRVGKMREARAVRDRYQDGLNDEADL